MCSRGVLKVVAINSFAGQHTCCVVSHQRKTLAPAMLIDPVNYRRVRSSHNETLRDPPGTRSALRRALFIFIHVTVRNALHLPSNTILPAPLASACRRK